MKTRLNILSLLILAVFIFAAGYEVYLGATDFRQGYNERSNTTTTTYRKEASKSLELPYYIDLTLNTKGDIPVDSIYSEKTGCFYPVEYTSMKIYPKEESPFWLILVVFCATFLIMLIFPLLIICFWKVISSVKQAKIFEHNNILRLRIIGLCFSLLAVLAGIPDFLMEIEAKKLVAIDGYSIVSGGWFSSSLWIYALISFLVAETFAIGLRLKEEQDLTI